MKGKSQLLSEVSRKVGLRADKGVLRDIAADIEWRKVSNLTMEKYADVVVARPQIGGVTVEQLLSVHEEFERVKDERQQIDFEDVLLLTAGLLATEDAALMEVRERYRFFVVDEYQDVSPLQHDLLSLWLGERRDICVVGDASQTIYSFTGASSRYLLEFPTTFPDARVVRLETSYRSTAPIVTVANHIMRDRPGAIALSTERVAGDAPVINAYVNDVAEARDVASKIAAEISRGTAAKDIAVLYRTNAQSAVLETALAEVGVNYQVSGETRFFDMPEVKQAIMSLRGASVSATTDPLFKSVSDVMRSLGWTLEPPTETGSIRSRWEALNALVLLADQAPHGTTLRDFSGELLARQEARHEPTMEAVTLSTIHSAKGLEWSSVYIIGLAEGSLPIWHATSEEAISEERRVLYVGITRAEKRLTLSWASGSGSHVATRVKSRFLAETGIGSRGETRSA
jgi:DNA helicase-2/ATP-dependent DNA helicase PcrA